MLEDPRKPIANRTFPSRQIIRDRRAFKGPLRALYRSGPIRRNGGLRGNGGFESEPARSGGSYSPVSGFPDRSWIKYLKDDVGANQCCIIYRKDPEKCPELDASAIHSYHSWRDSRRDQTRNRPQQPRAWIHGSCSQDHRSERKRERGQNCRYSSHVLWFIRGIGRTNSTTGTFPS